MNAAVNGQYKQADDLSKILPGCCQVTNVLNGAEKLPKISIG